MKRLILISVMHLPCLFYAHCCYMLASERTMLVYFPLMLYIVACFLRLFYLTYRNVPLLWLDGCRSSKHRRHTENSSNFLPLPASVRWHRIFCMCTFLLVVAFLQSFTLGFDFFFVSWLLSQDHERLQAEDVEPCDARIIILGSYGRYYSRAKPYSPLFLDLLGS